MTLKPARLKDQELVDEINQFASDENDFHLWWLGQSGYLLLWKGQRILLDPYLSDSLTEKYSNTDKPHVRMSERVIDPALFKNIIAITSSHNHTDHLDGSTLIPLIKNNPGAALIIPEANRQFVAHRIKQPLDYPSGLDAGTSLTIARFSFHGVPASHNEIEKDEKGQCKFLGYVIQFGGWTVYHSGDTLWYDGMEDLLKPFGIDLALLPINGNDPSRKVAGNLNAAEAALLGKSIGARVVIPCHYDMFTFNTADPADFVKEAQRIGQDYTILENGGHFSSASLRRI